MQKRKDGWIAEKWHKRLYNRSSIFFLTHVLCISYRKQLHKRFEPYCIKSSFLCQLPATYLRFSVGEKDCNISVPLCSLTSGPHSEVLTEVTNSRRNPSNSDPSIKPFPERKYMETHFYPMDAKIGLKSSRYICASHPHTKLCSYSNIGIRSQPTTVFVMLWNFGPFRQWS